MFIYVFVYVDLFWVGGGGVVYSTWFPTSWLLLFSRPLWQEHILQSCDDAGI